MAGCVCVIMMHLLALYKSCFDFFNLAMFVHTAGLLSLVCGCGPHVVAAAAGFGRSLLHLLAATPSRVAFPKFFCGVPSRKLTHHDLLAFTGVPSRRLRAWMAFMVQPRRLRAGICLCVLCQAVALSGRSIDGCGLAPLLLGCVWVLYMWPCVLPRRLCVSP